MNIRRVRGREISGKERKLVVGDVRSGQVSEGGMRAARHVSHA